MLKALGEDRCNFQKCDSYASDSSILRSKLNLVVSSWSDSVVDGLNDIVGEEVVVHYPVASIASSSDDGPDTELHKVGIKVLGTSSGHISVGDGTSQKKNEVESLHDAASPDNQVLGPGNIASIHIGIP